MIAGRQVQVTLRGVDEVEVLQRLENLLARFPVPQPPAPAPASRQGEGWCLVHQVAMQENHKDGRTWFSHRTEQGWCKGH